MKARNVVLSSLSLLFLVAWLPSGAAHPAFWSKGVAVDGASAYEVNVIRAEDVLGPLFQVRLTDLVTGEVLVDERFAGTDNYVDHVEGNVSPYMAQSTTVGIEFHLSGYQLGSQVWATGTYQAFDLVLVPNMGF